MNATVQTPCMGSRLLLLMIAGMGGCQRQDDGPTLDPAAVRTGRVIYEARCASCHGAAGQARPDWKVPDENGNYPPPPHDSTGHTWHHADGLLHRIVATGASDTVSRRRSRMPAFGATLTDGEIRAVLTYLKSQWTPAQRIRQAEVSRRDPFMPARDARRNAP